MKTKSNNSVRVYLPPLYKRLTEARAEYTGQSESAIVADAVKRVFDEIPMQERERILKFCEK